MAGNADRCAQAGPGWRGGGRRREEGQPVRRSREEIGSGDGRGKGRSGGGGDPGGGRKKTGRWEGVEELHGVLGDVSANGGVLEHECN